ncbi:MAG: hypothetical protein JST48_10665 [Bacteroidetes bacterium]|nr:hypothetical protein [Bacteroidota bacterium]
MEPMQAKIILKKSLWEALYAELGKRGKGETESGAFLLSAENSMEIVEFVCYDDLEPGCLDSGGIHLTAKGFIKLWDYCFENKLEVRADIHTHPGRSTRQSYIDKDNPMIKIKGHIGIIVPHLALPPQCEMNALGIHEFMGNGFVWKEWKFGDGIIKVI